MRNLTLGKAKKLSDVEYDELIPDYEDIMTLEEFELAVACHALIDYDGCGYYSTGNRMTNILAKPSDIAAGIVCREFSHVIWFNK